MLNVYVPDTKHPKHIKQNLTELKGETDKFIITVKGFNM